MKFTSIFALALAATATSVSGTPFKETNGERLARGLPPLPPQRRSGTPAYAAKRGSPSGSPGTCSTGSLQCCSSTGTDTNPIIAEILALLGIEVAADVVLGLGCSALSVVGLGSGSCSAQTVCCEDNSSSLISIGCIPIQL